MDLVQLEAVFDVMDLYLWLSYRFVELFPHAAAVRQTQTELDALIQQGVFQITRLLKNSEQAAASAATAAASGGGGGGSGSDGLRLPRTATFTRDARSPMGKGRLTDRLLAQGLLTPSMLLELQNEWDRRLKAKPTTAEVDENGVDDDVAARKTTRHRTATDDKPLTKKGTRRKRKT